MPHHRTPPLPSLRFHALMALTALCAAGQAQADPNPYYIGSSVTVRHDSNVFRLPNSTADTSHGLALIGGIDQPIGRQRLYASGTVQDTRFQDLKRLDHTNYSAKAGIDWATIYSLSGTLNHTRSQSLFNYGGNSTVISSARNLERRNESLASIRYGMASLLSLDSSYSQRKLSYSDAAFQFNALDQKAVSVGLTYRPRAALTLGTALRHTDGKSRNEREFTRRDLDLTANWEPSGLSAINARLSYGKRKDKNGVSAFDFTGTTGQLRWRYQPTGKLTFTTLLNRDTGDESGFINGQNAGTFGDDSRRTTALSVTTAYALSSKIRVDLSLYANRRALVQGPFSGRDSLRNASLGATYTPWRNVSLSCNVSRDSRSASGQVSFDYGNNSVSCSAQVTLQ